MFIILNKKDRAYNNPVFFMNSKSDKFVFVSDYRSFSQPDVMLAVQIR